MKPEPIYANGRAADTDATLLAAERRRKDALRRIAAVDRKYKAYVNGPKAHA